MNRAFAAAVVLQLLLTAAEAAHAQNSCKAIEWSVGDIAPRFKVSRDDLRGAIRIASEHWKEALGSEPFEEVQQGGVTIKLVDNGSQDILDSRRKREQSIASEARQLNAEAAAQSRTVDDFNRQAQSVKEEVEEFNRNAQRAQSKGSSPGWLANRAEALKLQSETLTRQREELAQRQQAVQAKINRFRQELAQLERQGDGKEMRVGQYSWNGSVKKIEVYAFGSQRELESTLVHEMGHALGLEHSGDPNSIMQASYRIESIMGGNVKIGPGDVQALKRKCNYSAASNTF